MPFCNLWCKNNHSFESTESWWLKFNVYMITFCLVWFCSSTATCFISVFKDLAWFLDCLCIGVGDLNKFGDIDHLLCERLWMLSHVISEKGYCFWPSSLLNYRDRAADFCRATQLFCFLCLGLKTVVFAGYSCFYVLKILFFYYFDLCYQ